MIAGVLEKIGKNLPDFKGVILIGTDGLTVEKHSKDETQIEPLIIEYLNLVKKLDTMMASSGYGHTMEMTIHGEKISFLLTRINPIYLLALAVGEGANLGRSRYELKKAVLELKAELPE
jgi:predicted regulator of Ras-like GTPase activity (Roadblock/LC7/MglB family)